MNNLPTFGAYAAAFEETLVDDDWSRLEAYFTEDAVYLPGDGTQATGRDAVLEALRDSVNRLDRKSDAREVAGAPDVSEDGDTVTLKFTVVFKKAGLPDLNLVGVETAQFRDGAIQRMEDVIEDPQAMQDWMAKL
ncbi:MAG: nuclear transport factor 2 family protein [Gammaproteobacteria bacterium]|nr:nuclear transport factor 2 family protein [Gammaproteobacteria bacterium]